MVTIWAVLITVSFFLNGAGFLNVLQLEVIYLPSESLGSYVLFLHGLCVILRNKQFMFLEVLRTLRVAELELSIRLSYTSDFRAEFKDCLSSFSALCDQNS